MKSSKRNINNSQLRAEVFRQKIKPRLSIISLPMLSTKINSLLSMMALNRDHTLLRKAVKMCLEDLSPRFKENLQMERSVNL